MFTAKKLERLNSYYQKYKIESPNLDCSEIAEDLFTAARIAGLNGKIVRIVPSYVNMKGTIKIIEHEDIKEFIYHDVFISNGRVYDMRYMKNVRITIAEESYMETIRNINGEENISFEIIEQS